MTFKGRISFPGELIDGAEIADERLQIRRKQNARYLRTIQQDLSEKGLCQSPTIKTVIRSDVGSMTWEQADAQDLVSSTR